MEKKQLNLIFLFVLLAMLSFTVFASLEVSLLEALPKLWERVWFKATILDFYLNQSIIWLITFQLEERSLKKSLPWIPIYFCLGSMGSALYFIYYINFKRNKNDRLFTR